MYFNRSSASTCCQAKHCSKPSRALARDLNGHVACLSIQNGNECSTLYRTMMAETEQTFQRMLETTGNPVWPICT